MEVTQGLRLESQTELFNEAIALVPSEGIAVLGTNLAKARKIQQEGFSGIGGLRCAYFNPEKGSERPADLLKRFRQALVYPWDYANSAARGAKKRNTDNTDEQKPALVVFIPPSTPAVLSEDSAVTNVALTDGEVTPNDIYGVIELPEIYYEDYKKEGGEGEDYIPRNKLNKVLVQIGELLKKPPQESQDLFGLKIDTGIPIDKNNPTAQEIIRAINNSDGKIPYSTFMGISLFGSDGYYSKGKVEIGEEADFNTSSESSELFGATLGNLALQMWQKMGKPNKFRIVELGAGHGGMAEALLKWAERINPDFYQHLQYTIVEYGDLIQSQRNRLDHLERVGWIQGSAYNIPIRDVKGLIISNELPDAFPIERVTRINGHVKQKYVAIEDGRWVEIWDEPSDEVIKYIEAFNIKVRKSVEESINLNAVRFQKQIDAVIERGAIVTIDYGNVGEIGKVRTPAVRFYRRLDQSKFVSGSTGEAFFADYKNLGNIDITASVNFAPLESVAEQDGLELVFSSTQGQLLEKLGIHDMSMLFLAFLRETKSWKEILEINSSLLHAPDLTDQDGYTHADIYTKNIPKDTIQDTASQHKTFAKPYSPRLKLGHPNKRIEIIFRDGSELEEKNFKSTLDNEGYFDFNKIELNFSQAIKSGMAVYSEGKLVFNAEDPNITKAVVEKSGYDYDI